MLHLWKGIHHQGKLEGTYSLKLLKEIAVALLILLNDVLLIIIIIIIIMLHIYTRVHVTLKSKEVIMK